MSGFPRFQAGLLTGALLTGALLTAVFTGCQRPATSPAVSVDGSKFLLSSEPADAQDVVKARELVMDAEDVVIVGRIGGGANPWVEGVAAFSIVDASLKACSDVPGDNCPVPWDYCCEADLTSATALVQVVDEKGQIVNADARRLLNVKELQTVVVKGKAKRDGAGNLTVLAAGVFVRP